MGATLISPMHEAITSRSLYRAVSPRSKPTLISTMIRGIGATLESWRERRAQRARLAHLNDRMLQDVGITRRQVEKEIRKPFWRP